MKESGSAFDVRPSCEDRPLVVLQHAKAQRQLLSSGIDPYTPSLNQNIAT
jgi:hypothetical protein